MNITSGLNIILPEINITTLITTVIITHITTAISDSETTVTTSDFMTITKPVFDPEAKWE